MGWRTTILGFLVVVATAAYLGVASGSSVRSRSDALVSAQVDEAPLFQCKEAPLLPPDDVAVGWGSDESGALMSVFWTKDADADEAYEYVVRVDDPTCDRRPDIRKYLAVDATPPRFENARIVVRPGEPRAYVGYTLTDPIGDLFARSDSITAAHSDGRAIEWKHQTATGGPADIGTKGRVDVEPADDVAPYTQTGDADYFDSAGLKVGETVTVTFRFIAMRDAFDESKAPTPRAVVKVPFRVIGSH